MSDWIILLGGRTPAIEAALALKLKVLLIAEPTTPKNLFAKAQKSIAFSLRGPIENLLPQVLTLMDGLIPRAIIGVSEQAILIAAQLREYYKLPGQGASSARDALIKSLMKKRFIAANLPCWPTVEIESIEQALSIAADYGYPLVVKALASSGSRGFKVIKNKLDLKRVVKSMLSRTDYGGIGIEPFCSLKECSVELVLHDGEVVFTNITDYVISSKLNLLPAKFTSLLTQKLINLSLKVASTFEFASGMLHIEFYYDEHQLWLGEVNARPPGGGLMDLIQRAYRFDPWRLVIESQLPQKLLKTERPQFSYTANWVIHPGRGKVKSIEGYQLVANHQLTAEFSLKLSLGQKVYRREGTGSSVGTLTMCSNNHQKLRSAILKATKTLKIEMEK